MRADILGGFEEGRSMDLEKRTRVLRRLGRIGAVGLFLALAYVYGVYRGYVHVNGPAAGRYPVRGIDVSHYQGEIDWGLVAGQGIDFAYVKATEGSSHVDERFAGNMAGAMEAGVFAGAYHFFSFDSPGISQAENFLETTGTFEGAMVPAVDVEFYGDKRENPPDAGAVETELRNFLDRVDADRGQRPVIYATREAWELYIRGRFQEYPLWIRDIWREPNLGEDAWEKGESAAGSDGEGNEQGDGPGDEPENGNGEKGWTFWQYTNRGRLKGFSGVEEFVDLNVFFGTEEQWEKWLAENLAGGRPGDIGEILEMGFAGRTAE